MTNEKITMTKAAFHEQKTKDYWGLFEYFKGTGDRMGRDQAAGMYHAHGYYSTEGDKQKWHYDNGRSFYRLQAKSSEGAYA